MQAEVCLREPGPVAQNQANSMVAAAMADRRWPFSAGALRSAALLGFMATTFGLCCGLSVLALEPSTPLADYGRQAWVMENGLP